jgi:hypothetical protein
MAELQHRSYNTQHTAREEHRHTGTFFLQLAGTTVEPGVWNTAAPGGRHRAWPGAATTLYIFTTARPGAQYTSWSTGAGAWGAGTDYWTHSTTRT